eukprot:NODE_489_length_1614_cov_275.595527_g372_i0.p1 GENE.NODE_489_length_1614_cov_275.595527_g372_i0~~NODE_489_length_1614_cov_275.595527_g372_i0.p1  ORF type:complete len:512 (-),score=105.62 NODE_489_length_1614_cov_275.595527_g372_i0:77-1525(-)
MPELGVTLRAKFDYTADPKIPKQLSFKKGDLITITSHGDSHRDGSDGWWHGRVGDSSAVGFFPYNYVEAPCTSPRSRSPSRLRSKSGSGSPPASEALQAQQSQMAALQVNKAVDVKARLGISPLPSRNVVLGKAAANSPTTVQQTYNADGIKVVGTKDKFFVTDSGVKHGDPDLRTEDMKGIVDKEMSFSDYEVVKGLGSGVQAFVDLVKHKRNGDLYARKALKLSSNPLKRTLQTELANILPGQHHPQLVASLNAFYVHETLYILMQYMDRGTVDDLIAARGPIPSLCLGYIATQLLTGLSFLHKKGLMHRDLKPSNFLLDSQGGVKIGDFGVVRLLDGTQPVGTAVGCVYYFSPERLIVGGTYNKSADVWAFGSAIAKCALGVYPFIDFTLQTDPFLKKIPQIKYRDMVLENKCRVDFDKLKTRISYFGKAVPVVTDEVRDFVRSCMKFEPQRRPSCDELLQHNFCKTGAVRGVFMCWMN